MRRVSVAFPVLASDGGRSHHLDEVRRFPMSEPHEEYIVAKRWREHEDCEAARRLVNRHLQNVIEVSRRLGGSASPDAPLHTESDWQNWLADGSVQDAMEKNLSHRAPPRAKAVA